MELREFVKDTLLAIIGGVEDTQDILKTGTGSAFVGHGNKMASSFRQSEVSFDVALVETSGKEKGGNIGVAIPKVIEAGGTARSKDSTSSTARVQFRVPIVYPRSKYSEGSRHSSSETRERV